MAEKDFMSEDQVVKFYLENPTSLNHHQLTHVLGWLKQDLDYVRHGRGDVPMNLCLSDILMTTLPEASSLMVFIDGSAFTAQAELNLGTRRASIVLDDTNDIKNFYNYHRLSTDPNYFLAEEDWHLRNGYAVFERRP